MADTNIATAVRDEAQLREARRRRILQNSEKRMQKIMGLTKPGSLSIEEEPVISMSADESSQLSLASPPETTKPEEPEIVPGETKVRQRFAPTVTKPHASDAKGILNTPRDEHPDDGANRGKNVHENGQMRGLALAFLALATVTLLLTDYAFLIQNNALVVFALWELYSLRESSAGDAELSGLVRAALMLSGLPPSTLQSFTHKFALIQKIFQDLCVYSFFILLFYQIAQLVY